MLTTEKVPVLMDTHLRIQRALSSPALDLIAIEQLIKSEPALCYRLLRYLESPGFYLQTEIMSILHALALLGEHELRKWLMLMASVVAAGGEPNPEPIARALELARFAELLAPFVALSASSLYLTSLFAQMDRHRESSAGGDRGRGSAAAGCAAALAGEATPLRQCQELVAAYERGDWRKSDALRRVLSDTGDRDAGHAARGGGVGGAHGELRSHGGADGDDAAGGARALGADCDAAPAVEWASRANRNVSEWKTAAGGDAGGDSLEVAVRYGELGRPALVHALFLQDADQQMSGVVQEGSFLDDFALQQRELVVLAHDHGWAATGCR